MLQFGLYLAVTLAILYVQVNDYNLAFRHGWFIPDTLNLSGTWDDMRVMGQSQDLFGANGGGLSFLYGWLWGFYPPLCYLINAALVLVGLILSRKLFVEALQLPSLASWGILANPYIYLVAAGPNKELPLMVMTVAFALLLVKRAPGYLIYATLVALFVYTIRDGYGAFLALFGFFFAARRGNSIQVMWALFFICFVTASSLSFLKTFVPIIARNAQAAEAADVAVGVLASAMSFDVSNPVGGAAIFLLRMLYNLLSLGLLPAITNVYGEIIAWGTSYWIEGELILLTFFACLFTVLRKGADRKLLLLAVMWLTTWFMISVSVFVQPRYLIPVIPLGFAVFAGLPIREKRYSIVGMAGLTFLVVYGYYLLGRPTITSNWVPDPTPIPSILQLN